jgi:hypothetical protein
MQSISSDSSSIGKSKLPGALASSRLSTVSKSYIDRARRAPGYSRHRGGDDLVEHYLDLDSAFGADSDSGESSGSEAAGDGAHVPLMAGQRGGPRGAGGGSSRSQGGEESTKQHILVRQSLRSLRYLYLF